jgi:hypothetical protein
MAERSEVVVVRAPTWWRALMASIVAWVDVRGWEIRPTGVKVRVADGLAIAVMALSAFSSRQPAIAVSAAKVRRLGDAGPAAAATMAVEEVDAGAVVLRRSDSTRGGSS